ncbi:helix-turn-helix transcriptional regulator [Paraburkholderia sp. J94]|uniref:helix-turn-helix transcriptional regulator n=1 Tax=Paraburkholderia sp. J94 TaxID=2805441 RepID=UPI002AB1C1C8|nr:helix-turn-helix transcriptional regulator [Paraburkholderia sp. J94]
MHLTSRELVLLADFFRVLAEPASSADALRADAAQRMLDLLGADDFAETAWRDEAIDGNLWIARGGHRDVASARERALFDLIRPAFAAAMARANGEVWIDAPPATADDLPQPDGDLLARLTRREREVVELAADGLLDKEIAQRLGISYTTVRTHLDRSFQKLGISNRSKLARLLQTARR